MNRLISAEITSVRASTRRTGRGWILVSAENRNTLNRRIGGRFHE